jgi:hypothetical protein
VAILDLVAFIYFASFNHSSLISFSNEILYGMCKICVHMYAYIHLRMKHEVKYIHYLFPLNLYNHCTIRIWPHAMINTVLHSFVHVLLLFSGDVTLQTGGSEDKCVYNFSDIQTSPHMIYTVFDSNQQWMRVSFPSFMYDLLWLFLCCQSDRSEMAEIQS